MPGLGGRLNYYEHHIGDYDADTAHLTWAEDMAYTRLLRLYYRREQPIPGDLAAACRLVRASSRDQKQAVEDVLKEFFVLVDGSWHQDRCDMEISVYQKKVEHNRTVGKLGGRPKKVKTHEEPTNNPPGSFREPKQNPPQSPVPSPQTNSVPDGTDGAAVHADMTKDELWKAGKSLLSQSGLPAAQCGSFVGKLVKDYGEMIVVDAVRTAVVERPANPVEYLKAACMRSVGQRGANEPAWRAEQRARTQQAAPGVAASAIPANQFFAEMEATNVAPRLLG